ncbi:hypothetical protein EKG40_03755 [Pseudomonas moorei]|nr:hypothetical protein EKG40_03755 [Pseudomonas moorei]
MEYNPFAAEYSKLMADVYRLKAEQKNWLNQLSWYEAFDTQSAFATINRLRREIQEMRDRGPIFQKRIEEFSRKIMVVEASQKPWYDIAYRFSATKKSHDLILTTLRVQRTALIEDAARVDSSLKTKEAEHAKASADAERHQAFDQLQHKAAVQASTPRIQGLEHQLAKLKPKKDKVDTRIGDLVTTMQDRRNTKQELEYNISLASRYSASLTNASDRTEKWHIHQECQQTLGDSKPDRVLNRLQRQLHSVNHDIEKLDARIRADAALAARDIQQLLIDGNNMCYHGRTFIGLAAVVEAVDDLACTCSIVVVFDSGIRGLLKMSDADIQAHFPDFVEVHVVATEQKADETLLTLAKEKSIFVISNDRFADFPDQPAVRENRLIRHSVTRERVLINELQVDRPYFTHSTRPHRQTS